MNLSSLIASYMPQVPGQNPWQGLRDYGLLTGAVAPNLGQGAAPQAPAPQAAASPYPAPLPPMASPEFSPQEMVDARNAGIMSLAIALGQNKPLGSALADGVAMGLQQRRSTLTSLMAERERQAQLARAQRLEELQTQMLQERHGWEGARAQRDAATFEEDRGLAPLRLSKAQLDLKNAELESELSRMKVEDYPSQQAFEQDMRKKQAQIAELNARSAAARVGYENTALNAQREANAKLAEERARMERDERRLMVFGEGGSANPVILGAASNIAPGLPPASASVVSAKIRAMAAEIEAENPVEAVAAAAKRLEEQALFELASKNVDMSAFAQLKLSDPDRYQAIVGALIAEDREALTRLISKNRRGFDGPGAWDALGPARPSTTPEFMRGR